MDSELAEEAFDFSVPMGHVLSVFLAGGLGADRDRHPVLVAPADEAHILALHAQRPHIYIGGQVRSDHVPEVDRAVGVGQGAGDEVGGQGRSCGSWGRAGKGQATPSYGRGVPGIEPGGRSPARVCPWALGWRYSLRPAATTRVPTQQCT